MLTEQTIQQLRNLRMHGFADAYKQQLDSGDLSMMTFDERLGLLVESECLMKEGRRTNKRLKAAKLKTQACIEDVECSEERGLPRQLVMELASCRWIRAKRNLLITGATGTGKTWFADALANKACRDGLTCLYAKVPRLVHELSLTRADGSYLNYLAKLAKTDLLILDDLALCPAEHEAQHLLLEVIDDRAGHRATVVTSQLPVESWYATFTDPTIADALLDRLLGNSQQIKLKGPSRRTNRRSRASQTDEKEAGQPAVV